MRRLVGSARSALAIMNEEQRVGREGGAGGARRPWERLQGSIERALGGGDDALEGNYLRLLGKRDRADVAVNAVGGEGKEQADPARATVALNAPAM